MWNALGVSLAFGYQAFSYSQTDSPERQKKSNERQQNPMKTNKPTQPSQKSLKTVKDALSLRIGNHQRKAQARHQAKRDNKGAGSKKK
jgi:hypothetical protein